MEKVYELLREWWLEGAEEPRNATPPKKEVKHQHDDKCSSRQ